ncbi:hypothetical protein EUGRSUZ_D00609 [Eucalyptus grandis]|uniref:Uncharacterized protein n=2 Tax=Eucalyptus grandis TaxID=71139 RepID=A0ACC3L2Q3_EUCGR|nr:hypothetical protein EUGRSUZ_D00609 [Eucalyptus grandis]
MATTSTLAATHLSSLPARHRHDHRSPRLSLFLKPSKPSSGPPRLSLLSSSSASRRAAAVRAGDIDTSFFDAVNPDADVAFDPPAPPEGFVPPPSFDDGPLEGEDEIAAAYEELYGPAYSGVSVLGNDVSVMDSKVKKTTGFGKVKREKVKDGFEERVIQVRRVTKVAKEVIGAVQKSAVNARRNIITVPMTKYLTFPHRSEGDYGAAKVMLRPASPGTGVIAGGAVRIVLEMAGVENALGKQLGSKNALNNARATVVAVQMMRQFRDVALDRGIPMEELWK